MSLFTMPNPLDVVREKLQATAKNAHIVKKGEHCRYTSVHLVEVRSYRCLFCCRCSVELAISTPSSLTPSSQTHEVLLEDGRSVNLRMSNSPSVAPVVQAEVHNSPYTNDGNPPVN